MGLNVASSVAMSSELAKKLCKGEISVGNRAQLIMLVILSRIGVTTTKIVVIRWM